MNWSDLPSLNSLRAFNVLAECGSLQRTARQLNVTPAAVSQHMRKLEQHFSCRLFAPSGRGVILTGDGMQLAAGLGEGFDQIRRAVAAMGGAGASRSVQVTMSPAFAVEWLLPRMGRFQQQNPDITLLLNPTAEILPHRLGGMDVAIRYTETPSGDQDMIPLLTSDMIVVGAPELLRGIDPADPCALLDLPWLQELGTREVSRWLDRQGIDVDQPMSISEMPGNLIMQAVRRGDGLTYTSRAFFKEELSSGRMVTLPFAPVTGYYQISVNPTASRPAVERFVEWLGGQAETVVSIAGDMQVAIKF